MKYPVMHILKRQLTLNEPIGKVWDFFSSPHNLKMISPPYLGFTITSGAEDNVMYPGQIITYKVKPVAGIPLTWVTEITQVEQYRFFIDEQRVGPYRMWHHEHHFKETAHGVEMTDIVTYKLPLGPLGSLAHWLFVKKQLEQIFDYRSKVVGKHFQIG